MADAELAQRFDHDAVIVGLLPVNDFGDGDFERARSLREAPGNAFYEGLGGR